MPWCLLPTTPSILPTATKHLDLLKVTRFFVPIELFEQIASKRYKYKVARNPFVCVLSVCVSTRSADQGLEWATCVTCRKSILADVFWREKVASFHLHWNGFQGVRSSEAPLNLPLLSYTPFNSSFEHNEAKFCRVLNQLLFVAENCSSGYGNFKVKQQ